MLLLVGARGVRRGSGFLLDRSCSVGDRVGGSCAGWGRRVVARRAALTAIGGLRDVSEHVVIDRECTVAVADLIEDRPLEKPGQPRQVREVRYSDDGANVPTMRTTGWMSTE